ncbi:Fringe-like protein [Metarhizium album ARSEF 1941]|uniref:N-acetylgalactosaminide beta-1,3-galactosyltransferase n=1 Tax=Metarhizium album (strain ARSEF 1941) TaxID=1081103 RepID=A0A0B2X311_METAS|nr:Fringe-like protein [Metarhizium album ARSEF 1941]KHO00148.1 Fringe-like protein [Metarhizium album ARSEF 1941]
MAIRRRRRLAQVAVLTALVVLSVLLVTLPPDSPAVLAVVFNSARLRSALLPGDRDAWLRGRARYPVHLASEVGCLIKTGYGTRHRVREQLRAFAVKGGVLGDEGRDYLVVGDWEPANATAEGGLGAAVVDAVGLVMRDGRLAGFADHARFGKYRNLGGAVDAGDEVRAQELGAKFGWELDALKFIAGMELSYRRMPHKKWYLILDDDTFVVKESLELLLSHLDPSKPQYVGNAVGDYKARFAHGGSAVVVSGAAMRMLFSRPDIVRDAYIRSLDETWGDRLVATTLQRIGVYIDERLSHYFNGEAPDMTRIRLDRVCSPVVSFHGLRKPGAMVHAGVTLGRTTRPVLWGQLWELFGQTRLESMEESALDKGDHVGPGEEEVKLWQGIKTARDCQYRCKGRCLAWTYYAETRVCRASPWLIVGPPTSGSEVSGIRLSAATSAFKRCSLAQVEGSSA